MGVEGFVQAVVEFVRAHQSWAAVIVFWLAFGESLAFISHLLPASVALVGIGALMGASDIPFVPIWIAGSIGAALGDWLSYWIGQKLGPKSREVWPLSRHPDLVPRGEAFIGKWGVFAIFIGRFFGPLRASVPLVAGILTMSFWPFQLANFSSAFLWAFTKLAIGDAGFRFLQWLS
jgi:membrane protein DedA with SNARE-associated domain